MAVCCSSAVRCLCLRGDPEPGEGKLVKLPSQDNVHSEVNSSKNTALLIKTLGCQGDKNPYVYNHDYYKRVLLHLTCTNTHVHESSEGSSYTTNPKSRGNHSSAHSGTPIHNHTKGRATEVPSLERTMYQGGVVD